MREDLENRVEDLESKIKCMELLIEHQNKTIIPDIAIPPGEFLAEILGSESWELYEAANAMKMTYEELKDIISGKGKITEGIAGKLARGTHVPARLWLNLEKDYRETLARITPAGSLCDENW